MLNVGNDGMRPLSTREDVLNRLHNRVYIGTLVGAAFIAANAGSVLARSLSEDEMALQQNQ